MQSLGSQFSAYVFLFIPLRHPCDIFVLCSIFINTDHCIIDEYWQKTIRQRSQEKKSHSRQTVDTLGKSEK
jgi:hypothetical protein